MGSVGKHDINVRLQTEPHVQCRACKSTTREKQRLKLEWKTELNGGDPWATIVKNL